ncbi:MAG: OmpA family protein [Deltaproteobacteria bacterium]|nr:OmpA family protein [Deltaproteobacteria bacterium]
MRRALAGVALATALSAAPTWAAEPKPVDHEVGLGVFGGMFVASNRHELYDLNLEWAKLRTVNPDFGLRLGYMPRDFLGAEAELAFMPSSAKDHSALVYALRAQAIAQLPAVGGTRLTPFLVAGLGTMQINSASDALGKDGDLALHWGLGAKYTLLDWLDVRLDVRHLLTPRHDALETSGPMTSNLETFLGVTYVIGRPVTTDRDNDGITDDKDKCLTVPGIPPEGCPRDTDEDKIPDEHDRCPALPGLPPDGCPSDVDKDGVFDKDDQCPTLKGVAPHGCPDRDLDKVPDRDDKCPDVAGVEPDGCPPDQDNDTVVDSQDQCPEVLGVAPHGCPDADGDGVFDAQDKCPSVAGIAPEGCPPDQDADGIPDAQDQCPAQPETKNGFQDDDGCPDEMPKALLAFTGAIEGINFEQGKATIQKGSYGKLDQAVKVLKEFSGVRLEISGHTDDSGPREVNLKLSQDRAQAVKDYLVSKGIDAGRLTARGAGPDEPVVDNKTPANRAKNRRIEFKVLQ